MQRKIPSLIEIKPFSIIGFSIFFVCAALIWVYQLNTVVTEAQTQVSLKLELSTSVKTYLQLEPLPINFKLSNKSANTIAWDGYLGLGENVKLISRSENGTEIQWFTTIDSPITGEVMQPDTKIEKPALIDKSLAKKLFPNSGLYQLRAEFTHRKSVNQQQVQIDTIISNPVDIEIKSPLGINLLAYQYLITHDLIGHGESLIERVAKQQNFVNNFPNSVYWKYEAFDLAYGYFQLKHYEKAEREFYNISDLNFFYTEKVNDFLEKLAVKLNRPNRRTKRPNIPDNPPVPRQISVPSVVPVPFPNNPPVLIPIPNANPNATPIKKSD